MNLKFKELAEQAKAEIRSEEEIEGIAYNDFDEQVIEKFAELIVKECVQICKTVNSVKVVNAPDDYQEGREMGSLLCMEEIKEHFGVK